LLLLPRGAQRLLRLPRETPPRVTYAVADVRATGWADGSVDALIDKATLDTLLNISDAAGAATLAEAARVLRPRTGLLLCVSSGAPAERLPLLLARHTSCGSGCGDGAGAGAAAAGEAASAPPFELVTHAELLRGRRAYHAYVLRRSADGAAA
jgi:hypothetical protein